MNILFWNVQTRDYVILHVDGVTWWRLSKAKQEWKDKIVIKTQTHNRNNKNNIVDTHTKRI